MNQFCFFIEKEMEIFPKNYYSNTDIFYIKKYLFFSEMQTKCSIFYLN